MLEPYCVDFRQIDRMAQSFGFGVESLERIEAGIAFELYYNENEGHVCLPAQRLVEVTAQFLSIAPEKAAEAMALMAADGTVVLCTVGGMEMCYLKMMYEAEEYAARRLVFLSSRRYEKPRGADLALAELEAGFGIDFSEDVYKRQPHGFGRIRREHGRIRLHAAELIADERFADRAFVVKRRDDRGGKFDVLFPRV